jgi:AAHS family 4-hydroxybenzoate transporter-like MFS transporter
MQIVAFTLFAGIGVAGGQLAINALAGGLYPAEIRSTGAGWALGIGRVGNIGGPILGGILFALQWTPQHIVLAASVPVALSILAVVALMRKGEASIRLTPAPTN